MSNFHDRRPRPVLSAGTHTAGDIASHLAYEHDMHHVEIDGGARGGRGAYKLTGRMSKAKALAAHDELHSQGTDHSHG